MPQKQPDASYPEDTYTVVTTNDWPMASPFAGILAWAEAWPKWQRDALRRIVLYEILSPADYAELAMICKSEHGLAPETGEAPIPELLSAEHIPSGPDAASSVSLVKLGNLTNVNRLPNDQTLEFGPGPGLTVVYGENGSGKSGYFRVIKKACRARGIAPELKPNAFDLAPPGPATAEFVCSVGAVQTPLKWTDGVPGDHRLANIFVFDAMSARFHVTEDGPAVFTPRGLDVLPKLARGCDELKKRLKTEADAIAGAIAQSQLNWKFNRETTVGRLLANLSHDTSDTDIATLASFTEVDQKRLAELTEALNSDPKQKAQTTAAAARRIRTFADQMDAHAKVVDDAGMDRIKTALADAATANAAARVVTGPEFDDTFLPGTGGNAWRQLWETARSYSTTEAYPDKEFPVTDSSAQCVLCQQVLDSEASTRLARFDQYVRHETRSRAEAANRQVSALANDFNAIDPLLSEQASIAADIAAEPPELLAAIDSYVELVDARLAYVQKCLSDRLWSEAPLLPASPAQSLRYIADALDKRSEMELSALAPDKRAMLSAELDDLADKEWLSRNSTEVYKALALSKKAALLTNCQADTATNTITIKSGELHDRFVTTAFCESFESERDTLGLKTLPIKLQSVRGSKGERRFGVRLDAATPLKVGEVASEGEHCCAALAAFLAELSQASHKSALVLDDPVSSLDHHRRSLIADRLVTESHIRQVIVFTHDLAFLCDLQHAAEKHGVALNGRHLDWSATGPGRCHSDLPWDGQPTKGQIKLLRESCSKAHKIQREQGQDEYHDFALNVCNRIRACAERIVEEILLNGVLLRHRSGIHMGALDSLGVVETADYAAVHEVWKDCSSLIPSHSASRSKPVSPPDPAKLSDYVDILERVVKSVKDRRRTASSRSSAAPTCVPSYLSVT